MPPAVCPSLLESTTTVYTSFLQSLSTCVHTPTPHSIFRFRPAPQTPDLHTSNLPHCCTFSTTALDMFGAGRIYHGTTPLCLDFLYISVCALPVARFFVAVPDELYINHYYSYASNYQYLPTLHRTPKYTRAKQS